MAAWCNAYRECARQTPWEPHYRTGLEAIALGAQQYVQMVLEQDPQAEELRRHVRELMAMFLLIGEHEVTGGQLLGDGTDADIARLCGLGTVVH